MNNLILKEFLGVIPSVIAKIKSVFSYSTSKFLVLMTFLASCLGPGIEVVHYILVATLLDLIWATIATVKKNKFILSIFISKTAFKLAMYLTTILMVAIVEKTLLGESAYVTRTAGSILCAAELWSVLGHILIVSPNNKLLKGLKKYLIHEIERKIGINLDLEDKRNAKKKNTTRRKRVLSDRISE